ncbi:MAG: phosphatidylglycerophosphatase A [Vicingus serpentipes]|nr:phosphatidylglycerophosphatase A [Vicingus serpentipes]
MKLIYKLLATSFGSGYSPFAPGTAGAIVGCILLWLLQKYQLIDTFNTPILFVGFISIVTLIGIFVTNKLEEDWGKDPSKVVIDETIGLWISMILVPFTWLNLLLAFILFRFFDIAKPLGVRKMESLKGGLGVMADDVLAGIYANIVLQVIIYFL